MYLAYRLDCPCMRGMRPEEPAHNQIMPELLIGRNYGTPIQVLKIMPGPIHIPRESS